jgi:hypothetical protein
MTIAEREIIEKFRQLEPESRARVLAALQVEVVEEQAFNLEEWLEEIEKVRLNLRPDSSGHLPSVSDMVNEVREERDADILRSLGFRDPAGDSADSTD